MTKEEWIILESIVNAIGEISKTEALDALERALMPFGPARPKPTTEKPNGKK